MNKITNDTKSDQKIDKLCRKWYDILGDSFCWEGSDKLEPYEEEYRLEMIAEFKKLFKLLNR